MPVRNLSTLRAILELPRPLNCLITFLSVLLSGWLGIQTLTPPLLLAALSAALITGGGNAFNDLCGLTEDRINKPHRPLPSKRLSPGLAQIETILLLILGLALSVPLPNRAHTVALLAVLLLLIYNTHLKRVPLLGNLVVSLLGSLAFLYGGFAVQSVQSAYLPALFAFLFHLGREILKDLEDCEGDRHLAGGTVPLRWGTQTTRRLITGVFIALIALMPIPAALNLHGMPYLVSIAVLTLLLIYILKKLQTTPISELRRLNNLLKVGMLIGLSAFFFDAL